MFRVSTDGNTNIPSSISFLNSSVFPQLVNLSFKVLQQMEVQTSFVLSEYLLLLVLLVLLVLQLSIS